MAGAACAPWSSTRAVRTPAAGRAPSRRWRRAIKAPDSAIELVMMPVRSFFHSNMRSSCAAPRPTRRKGWVSLRVRQVCTWSMWSCRFWPTPGSVAHWHPARAVRRRGRCPTASTSAASRRRPERRSPRAAPALRVPRPGRTTPVARPPSTTMRARHAFSTRQVQPPQVRRRGRPLAALQPFAVPVRHLVHERAELLGAVVVGNVGHAVPAPPPPGRCWFSGLGLHRAVERPAAAVVASLPVRSRCARRALEQRQHLVVRPAGLPSATSGRSPSGCRARRASR